MDGYIHTKLTGTDKQQGLVANTELALWHIKSMEKQESRWDGEVFKSPEGDNLYDTLM